MFPAHHATRYGITNLKLPRRKFLRLAAAAALPAASRAAEAQNYPSRPVRLIVGFPPGGVADILARLIGQWLSKQLGQPFIIENQPGAGATIATQAVVRAAPDGYTLLWVSVANPVSSGLYDNLRFDFIRDIAPVSSIAQVPLVMEVNLSVPAKSLSEFIDFAKSNPGKINWASGGKGTMNHLSGELFTKLAGVDMLQVPYRGTAAALTDLLGGQVQVLFDNLPSSIEYIKSGKLRALAVTTNTRSPALPEIPTIGESVPSYDTSTWVGIGAPKKTPTEIVDRLNKEINAALSDPDMNARFADVGATTLPGSPVDFAKLIANETEKWGKVIRAANIKPD
jgi:tripartite-type tricarboxylate transporter receptor subunit TctC